MPLEVQNMKYANRFFKQKSPSKIKTSGETKKINLNKTKIIISLELS